MLKSISGREIDGLDPQAVLLLMLIKIIVLEINSTLKGIRKHHNDFLGVAKETKGSMELIFICSSLSSLSLNVKLIP